MAATYPRDVIEAADWSRAHPGLQGDDAVRAVQDEDWDPSVKSLVASPQLLARMDEKIDWTRDLGDAFLAQEAQVVDTVQQLRQRARGAGNLQSSEELYVQQQGPTITINLASPQYLYVPYYDPMAVYGSWWWPGYQPVVWAPWPGYARRYHGGASIGFWWGAPVRLSANFFFGSFDWHQHHVHVVQVNNYYYRPSMIVNRTVVVAPGRWQHDPQHRRDVAYRDAAVRPQAQAQVQQPQPQPRAERRDARRTERPAAPAQAQEAQRHVRPEQHPSMPAAQAPQTPRAERAEKRQEHQDRRNERDHKGNERS